jgi:hypothetical protein
MISRQLPLSPAVGACTFPVPRTHKTIIAFRVARSFPFVHLAALSSHRRAAASGSTGPSHERSGVLWQVDVARTGVIPLG